MPFRTWKKKSHITGKHWHIPVTYSTISMRQGLLFERLVLAIWKRNCMANPHESWEVFALTTVAPWVKPPTWPVFCWWLWDATAIVLSEECFRRQGQDNDLAMICFCFLFSILGSPPDVKHVCCVFKPTGGPVEILCSDGEVVVVTRYIGTSDTAFFSTSQWWLVRVECQGKEERSCLWLSRRDGNQTQTSSNSCGEVWHRKALLCLPLLQIQKNWSMQLHILFLLTSSLSYTFD